MTSRSASEPLCAAIDLGTNTFLMLVGRTRADGQLEIVEDVCRTPRLGAGLASSGRIAGDAIARGLGVLAEFGDRLRELEVDPRNVRAVGTAALRRASNAGEFGALARERTGLTLEVIDAEEEARLGYSAVIAEGASARSVIVDVGGGSSEVVADAGRTRVSAPIGAVVLTERWQGDLEGRAWTDTQWLALIRDVERACCDLPSGVATADGGCATVLGGTGANLACLVAGFERFDPRAAEGRRISAGQVAAWAERLRRLGLDERLLLPLERERAAILPAGLACLAAVLRRIAATEIRITGRGLRYGVLRDLCRRRAPA